MEGYNRIKLPEEKPIAIFCMNPPKHIFLFINQSPDLKHS